MAKMAGSEVRQSLSTTTPPRAPTSSPQARPSASCGRMPAEKTISRLEEVAVLEVHAVGVFLTDDDVLGGSRQVHAHAQRLDARLERGAAGIVELHRHQPRGELDHVRFQTEGLERIGRFQAEQAAADHHAAAGAGCGGTNRIEVFERAVDQPGIAFGAGNRRYEGVGAGGENQLVVRLAADAGKHFAALAIDLQHLHAEVRLHAVLV